MSSTCEIQGRYGGDIGEISCLHVEHLLGGVRAVRPVDDVLRRVQAALALEPLAVLRYACKWGQGWG